MRALLLGLLVLATAASGAAQNLNRLELFTLRSNQLDQSGLGTQGAMSVLPDVTGDGRAELALGASQENNGAGRVYIVNGIARTVLRVVASPQTIQSEGFGTAVAGLADVTGDGRGDLLVGAPGASVGGVSGSGRAYLVDGATGAIVRTLDGHALAPGVYVVRLAQGDAISTRRLTRVR